MKEKRIVKIDMDLVVTNEDIDDIMCSALEGGINYWCCRAEVEGEYLGEYGSEQISRGGVLRLYDSEEKKEYELTKEMFLNGLRKYISLGNRKCLVTEIGNYGITTGKLLVDAGNIDAASADAIIQYALFDDIIYG